MAKSISSTIYVLLTLDFQVIAHAPMLDLGGLIKPGSIVRMTESKPGGKTSHAVQLVRQVEKFLFAGFGMSGCIITSFIYGQVCRVDEVECGEGGTTWVGANPMLGNKVAFFHRHNHIAHKIFSALC